ncbi:MAG TPA: outer membrane lipoprotein carrier protein LolA [Terriglobales bacterium]|jgi:outer membrane lipoprotein-sorting protein
MKIKKLYLHRIVLFLFLSPFFFTNDSAAASKAATDKASAPDKAADKTTANKSAAESKADVLEQTLTSMDKAAANFKAIEANFAWDQFTKVVEQTETQTGKIYFRRVKNETQMMADVTGPQASDKKSVLYANSKFQIYQPGEVDQVTIYDLSKKPEVESFLVLGFGGRGHDLSKSFDVTYVGSEKAGGVQTEKINLVPKSEKVKNNFDHIILWIDPARGISVQQQLLAPNGDYRLTRYSDIHLVDKLPDNVFKLKTDSKTKFLTP